MKDTLEIKNEISELKRQIQNIIDKKKGVTNINEIRELDTVKKTQLGRLKRLSKRLKEIYAEERAKRDIKITGNMVDSIEFEGAKKTKTQGAMEKARKNKQKREEVKLKYLEYVDTESRYLERDSQDTPGMFFLHESVLSKYGLCPFMDIDITSDNIEAIQKDIYIKRKQWLNEQEDSGEIYYNLYKKVFLQYEFEALKVKQSTKEEDLDKQLRNAFSESQLEIYLESLELLEEYNTCPVKTKRVKEKFKMVIQKISILFAETLMPLHEYLALKTNNSNLLSINEVQVNIKNAESYTFVRKLFSDTLQDYKQLLEEIEEKRKYNANTQRNLKNELYLYLTKQKTYLTYDKPSNGFQIGKYFTRWNNLSADEKDERFESYAEFYVDRYMLRQQLTTKDDKPLVVEKIAHLLKKAYQSKQMIYRDFAWKTKKGLIEAVHTLRYDQENKEFFLARIKVDGKVKMVKKKASTRTIFTKDNQRLINETMLTFVLDNKDGLSKIEDTHVTECINKLKDKLRIKKLLNQDKEEVRKKLQEILHVVLNNKNE